MKLLRNSLKVTGQEVRNENRLLSNSLQSAEVSEAFVSKRSNIAISDVKKFFNFEQPSPTFSLLLRQDTGANRVNSIINYARFKIVRSSLRLTSISE